MVYTSGRGDNSRAAAQAATDAAATAAHLVAKRASRGSDGGGSALGGGAAAGAVEPPPPVGPCFELCLPLGAADPRGGGGPARAWVYPEHRSVTVRPLFARSALAAGELAGAPVSAQALRDLWEANRQRGPSPGPSGAGFASGGGGTGGSEELELLDLLCAVLGVGRQVVSVAGTQTPLAASAPAAPPPVPAEAKDPSGAAGAAKGEVSDGGGSDDNDDDDDGSAKGEVPGGDDAKGEEKEPSDDSKVGGKEEMALAAAHNERPESATAAAATAAGSLKVALSSAAVAALGDVELPGRLLGDVEGLFARMGPSTQRRLVRLAQDQAGGRPAAAAAAAAPHGLGVASGVASGLGAVRLYLCALGGLVLELRAVRAKGQDRRAALAAMGLSEALEVASAAAATGRLPAAPPPLDTSLATSLATAGGQGGGEGGGGEGVEAPPPTAEAGVAAWRRPVRPTLWRALSAREQAAVCAVKALHPALCWQWLVRPQHKRRRRGERRSSRGWRWGHFELVPALGVPFLLLRFVDCFAVKARGALHSLRASLGAPAQPLGLRRVAGRVERRAARAERARGHEQQRRRGGGGGGSRRRPRGWQRGLEPPPRLHQ